MERCATLHNGISAQSEKEQMNTQLHMWCIVPMQSADEVLAPLLWTHIFSEKKVLAHQGSVIVLSNFVLDFGDKLYPTYPILEQLSAENTQAVFGFAAFVQSWPCKLVFPLFPTEPIFL